MEKWSVDKIKCTCVCMTNNKLFSWKTQRLILAVSTVAVRLSVRMRNIRPTLKIVYCV